MTAVLRAFVLSQQKSTLKRLFPRVPLSVGRFSTGSDKIEEKNVLSEKLLDTSITGVGQVIFLNSKFSGQIVLASLLIGDPFTASMATLGSLVSSSVSYSSGMDKDTTTAGLYSYNGCLVGCVASVFVAPESILTAATFTIAGSTLSAYTTASLSRAITMPQWTIAFNLVSLTALLRLQPLAQVASTDVIPATPVAVSSIALSPLVGISQIFVVNSALSGAGIVGAIYNYSPMLAAHTLGGSLTGCLVGGLVYGVPSSELAAGLWGFNSALTSMGVAVFFVPSVQSNTLSFVGAAATAAVFGSFQTVFGMVGSPCLTLPFCMTMSGCYLLGSTPLAKPLVPGLLLAASPHSPEKNNVKG